MGTFQRLEVGESIISAGFAVTEADVRTLIGMTGYTHPLFTDPDYARSTPFGTTPLPGQLVLAVMGGLAEQTGVFDETVIALVAIDEARFHAAAVPGDVLTLHLEVVDKESSERSGHGTIRFSNRCTNQRDELVASASSTLLFRC